MSKCKKCSVMLALSVDLLKAQICMISFQTCTQIFGIYQALVHGKRWNLIRQKSFS